MRGGEWEEACGGPGFDWEQGRGGVRWYWRTAGLWDQRGRDEDGAEARRRQAVRADRALQFGSLKYFIKSD